MESGEEKKGFTIRDRRFSSQQEEPAKGESGKEQKISEPPSLPEINFSSFIFSLGTSTLLHLGEVPDPVTQKREKNLPLAKQTIDILGMLREKTQGNLTPDEQKLIENLLTDLRWRYIREAKGQQE
ncbi:MAG: DUF1844 domain-containing protein [Deltaproteobacteria bacterium]|nr:DUF1844 domain-containing protein [Deltaproteobacteria bacterium]